MAQTIAPEAYAAAILIPASAGALPAGAPPDEVREPSGPAEQPGLRGAPERFVRRAPRPPDLPTAVWINPPPKTEVPIQ